MSTTSEIPPEVRDTCEQFLREYYTDEIAALAYDYPTRTSLIVDWPDVFQFDPEFADDLRANPDQVLASLEDAVDSVGIPIDEDLSDVRVRVRNLNEVDVYHIGELRQEHRGRLLAVRDQVTKRTDLNGFAEVAAFECQRCGTITRIPQADEDQQTPHECQGCERQGPFRLNLDESEMKNQQQLRIQEPPEQASGATGWTIDVTVEGEDMDIGFQSALFGLPLAAEIKPRKVEDNTIQGLRAAEEAGKWIGRPPFGFSTDEDGYLQPTDEFSSAVEAIEAVEELGWSHRKAARHTGVPRRTIPNILEPKDVYLAEDEE